MTTEWPKVFMVIFILVMLTIGTFQFSEWNRKCWAHQGKIVASDKRIYCYYATHEKLQILMVKPR